MRLLPIAPLLLSLAACATPAVQDVPVQPEVATQTEPDALPPLREAALDWVTQNFDANAQVLYGESDLDGDGTMEALVYVAGPGWCGSGGCDLVVLRRASSGMQVLGKTTVTRAPLGVLDSKTDGMRDLWVSVGGGGLESGYRKLPWQGTAYPANPTVAPAEEIDRMGETVIADDTPQPIAEAMQADEE